MQPLEIAAIAACDRIAFSLQRSVIPPELNTTDAIAFSVPIESLHTVGERAGPDLWIIEDDHALESAWRLRGWAGVVALVGLTRKWMADADGRFVLTPTLQSEDFVRLRELAREELATFETQTAYEACSLRTRDRMLRCALRKTKQERKEPCVSTAAAALGISRQLCQKHLRELGEAWLTPMKPTREPTSGVMQRIGPRILIVEDDVRVVRSLQRSLRCAKSISAVTSAKEAERVLTEHAWDVVLLDIHLGAANGLEVLARARKTGCKSRVIVLTGDYCKAQHDFAEMLGIEAFLGKGAHDEIDSATSDNLLFRVAAALLRP